MEKLFAISFILFFLWILFGGMLEDQSAYDNKNTTTIDCNLSGWKNDPRCTGEYADQIDADEVRIDDVYPH